MKIETLKAKLFFSLLVITCYLLAANSVYAQEGNTLEVVPSFVDVILSNASSEAKIVLTYINHSDKTVNLELFPLDFQQQDDTGVITFVGKDAQNFSYSLTSFLSFESHTIELAPQEKKQFTVTATNRADLSPGGHYAAVIARLVSNGQQSSTARIAPSVSSFILLRKTGGERFNLSLKSSNWTNNIVFGYPPNIKLQFQNEGNIHLVPYGTVEIRDMWHRLLYKGIINTSSLRVFPETRRTIAVQLNKLTFSWPISFNSLEVSGQDSLQKTHFAYKKAFVYINWWFLFAVIVIIMVLFKWKKKRK